MVEITPYLQFQLVKVNNEIEKLYEEISKMESEKSFGAKLTKLRNRLEYSKGCRDTLTELWRYRKEHE